MIEAIDAGVDFSSVPVQRKPSLVRNAGGVTFRIRSARRLPPVNEMLACASAGLGFWAVTSQRVVSPTTSVVAAHGCVSATLPCFAKNATGSTGPAARGRLRGT